MQYSGINSMLDMSHTAVNTYDVQTRESYKGVWSEFDLTPLLQRYAHSCIVHYETDTLYKSAHHSTTNGCGHTTEVMYNTFQCKPVLYWVVYHVTC